MTRALLYGLGIASTLALLGGCGDEAALPPPPPPGPVGTEVPGDEQRPGDAEAGYHALVHEGYVGCGVPYDFYTQFFGTAPLALQLPGREGKNANMQYSFNVYTTPSGVDVVMPNCLSCHATTFGGEIVVGLGNTSQDYTISTAAQLDVAVSLIDDPDEKAEMAKFAERAKAIEPFTKPATIGVNPAENITAVLLAHRDRDTLAWSNEPLLELPPEWVVPVDVPPWWRMQKKNAMFYVAAGRGDHARIMMTASTLCVDDVASAEVIDGYFPDVRAYIASLEPPAYPGSIDSALAEQGQAIFEATCSQCHGTYGPGGSYPNLLIATDDVGTDPLLARGSAHHADAYVDWYNESYYGEISTIAPQDGYVAPPLDGIWITAPFLHNGSVPNLQTLLDSSSRPTYFTRSYDSADYDLALVGWPYTPVEAGGDKTIYDTTLPGYSNAGHTYGDALSPAERSAVIEYLKTL